MALAWYLKAAEQEDPLAQFALGCLFEVGAGQAVPKSTAAALEWYAKAAAAVEPHQLTAGGATTVAGQPAGGSSDAADSAVARAGRMALARLRVARNSFPLPVAASPGTRLRTDGSGGGGTPLSVGSGAAASQTLEARDLMNRLAQITDELRESLSDDEDLEDGDEAEAYEHGTDTRE